MLIDAIIAPVDCFYFVTLAYATTATHWQCQATHTGFCLSECEEVKEIKVTETAVVKCKQVP